MNVLITGGGGQLGRALARLAPAAVTLHCPTRDELDITDREQVAAALTRVDASVVVNAAAYTQVDRAEEDVDASRAVNARAPGDLARLCASRGARLIHVSTDYVFDGNACRPYQPDAVCAPASQYGQSKLDGERAVREVADLASVIVRLSWLYGAEGSNFVMTMLRLMNSRDDLAIVADQVGGPTWTDGAADAIWRIVADANVTGVHHWSDLGVASWYDFAVAILREGCAAGLIDRDVQVRPIATHEYPTAATRPAYSVLDTRALRDALGVTGSHWQTNLRHMLAQVAAAR